MTRRAPAFVALTSVYRLGPAKNRPLPLQERNALFSTFVFRGHELNTEMIGDMSGGNIQITDEGVSQFLDREKFPKLDTVDLSGCLKVSQSMIEKLRDHGLNVIRD